MSVLSRSEVRTTEEGVRTVEVVTDGTVGSEAFARAVAVTAFQSVAAYLSFRKSEWGELRFYFTDRMVTS